MNTQYLLLPGIYIVAVLLLSVAGTLLTYLLQRTRGWLPLNPQGFGNVAAENSFDTEALLDGLELLPREVVEHRGRQREEFDVDAARARRSCNASTGTAIAQLQYHPPAARRIGTDARVLAGQVEIVVWD